MIDIELNNYEDAFNMFNQEEISESLNDYIVKKSKMVKGNITLNIIGDLSEEEKDKFVTAIHRYYGLQTKNSKQIDRYDDYYRIGLVLIGSLIIIISDLFDFFLGEVLLIAGWVVIYESFYDLLFNSAKRKFNRMKYQKLSKCKFLFSGKE